MTTPIAPADAASSSAAPASLWARVTPLWCQAQR
jgi:hypothetical protein